MRCGGGAGGDGGRARVSNHLGLSVEERMSSLGLFWTRGEWFVALGMRNVRVFLGVRSDCFSYNGSDIYARRPGRRTCNFMLWDSEHSRHNQVG